MLSPLSPAEAAREMDRILRALAQAQRAVAGLDQIRGALELSTTTRYSALRTTIEQAQASSERVQATLRILAGTDFEGPIPGESANR